MESCRAGYMGVQGSWIILLLDENDDTGIFVKAFNDFEVTLGDVVTVLKTGMDNRPFVKLSLTKHGGRFMKVEFGEENPGQSIPRSMQPAFEWCS